MKKITLALAVVLSGAPNAAELQHNFNSPAFSGLGYSSHVLTLKQLEDPSEVAARRGVSLKKVFQG